MTVIAALRRFETTNNPFEGSTDPKTAGNGALMRLAPVVIYYFPDQDMIQKYAVESTQTTHAAPEALDCTRLLSAVITSGLAGQSKETMLKAESLRLTSPKVMGLAEGSYCDKPESEISGSGYAVASLEAALWCFQRTQSFREAVLCAANLGDDADTTAAIVGQIAGSHYGIKGIPPEWRSKLFRGREIEMIARRLGSLFQPIEP